MESLVSSPNVVGGSGERNSYSKQPSKPIFPVEIDAAQFIKTQRYGNHIWNTRESRTFGYFVEYLRMLRISDYSQIDPAFFNNLRHNIIFTFYEGALSKLSLQHLCSCIDVFLDAKIDTGLTPVFYEEEIFDLFHEREKFSRFDADSFEECLDELRYARLHTEAAQLEVCRYLGLTMKEAIHLNAALSLDYARKNESIVIRNQDGQMSRRIPVWNEDQMTSLIRLATNRLMHSPDEAYRTKKFAYLFSPLNQVYKYLSNFDLSIYALRKEYFLEEFYRGADPQITSHGINQRAHSVSNLMGHPHCFDESVLYLTQLSERKIAAADSILEKHPMKLVLPDPIVEYLDAYRNRASHNS